jgi:predicted CoA-binding protein
MPSETFPLTVIIGATNNEHRYAYKAAEMLKKRNLPFKLVGLKAGVMVLGEPILPFGEPIKNVDTVTLYLGAKNQVEHYDYILSLKPKRIIFNPGAENSELVKLAESNQIEVENACSLVLLSMNSFY